MIRYTLKNTAKPVAPNVPFILTTRELSLLKFLAKGLSNKQIASEMDISQRTVKSHLVDIFLKLNISSRIEAVIVGLRNGFLNLEDLN